MPNRKRNGSGEYNELSHIKEDMDSIKANVFALARHLQEDSGQQLQEAMQGIKTSSQRKLQTMERNIQEKPVQSMVWAFCAGAILSQLMRWRRN